MQATSDRDTLGLTIPAASDIRYMAEGLEFPEGPIAMSDGSVLLVEIAAGRLTRVKSDGTIETVAEVGGGPNGAAIGPDGSCYICNNGGFSWHRDENGLRPMGPAVDYAGGRIEKVDLKTGAVTLLYEKGEHEPLRAPNDLVFDRHGGFWFSDVGVGRHRDLDRGSVYYAQADGSGIREIAFPMVQPNGVGLSPEEDTLYVAETLTGRLWAFDLDGPGEIRRASWPSPHGGRLLANMKGYRFLDSLAVDATGNIFIATLYEGGIVVISPEGRMLADIRLPDRIVTNICFGGNGLNTSFITMSHTGRLAAINLGYTGLPLNHAI